MDKKAYQELLEAQLKEWRAELDKLHAQAEKKKAETKIDFRERIDELETKIEEMESKLEVLKETGEETWHNVKQELDKGAKEFKEKFTNLFLK